MKNKVVLISLSEGSEMICLPPWRHGLTQKMVMSLPKKDKYPSIAWGGWIHAFWCFDRFMGLRRYDAVND